MKFLLAILGIFFAAETSEAKAPDVAGRWVGELHMSNASMPIELTLGDGQQSTAELWFPALINYQTVAANRKKSGIAVAFPFGLGSMLLSPANNGQILANEPGRIAITLRKVGAPTHRTEELKIPTPAGLLAATLYIPAGVAQAPAVLLAGGAVALRRNHPTVVSWCQFFVRRRLACLVTDKGDDPAVPGSADIERDSRELGSALAYLRTRAEVDAARVGLASFSRGGWPAVRLAAGDERLAFLIATAPPSFSPMESERLSAVAKVKAAGRPADQISAVEEYYRLYGAVAAGNQPWSVLERAARAAEKAPWGEFVDQPLKPTDIAFWRNNGRFSNEQDFERVKAPVLALWGADDPIVPPAAHEPGFRSRLTSARSVRTYIFAEADHSIEVQPGADRLGNFRFPARSAGMIPLIDQWLNDYAAKPSYRTPKK